MVTKLIFVRHGEAEGNLKRVFHGWTDSGLTLKGCAQAEKVAKRLKTERIDIIYSSPLKRAYETAKFIAREKEIQNITTLEGLREINGGDWENERWDELPVKWPDEYNTWEENPHLHCMPMGESMKEAFDRILNVVFSIIAENKGKNICIVTHGTVLRSLICYFYGKPFEELVTITWHDNTSVTIVEFNSEKFNVSMEGDISHLGEGMSTFETQDWWIQKHKNMTK